MRRDIETETTRATRPRTVEPPRTAPRTGTDPAAQPRPAGSRLIGQLASFGLVGGLAFIVDLVVYNTVRATVLQDSPIWSKVVSVAVATAFAWLGNRYLTFRRDRSPHAVREGILFAVVNVVGLLIAAGCLFVSHYVLGFTSQLADNISGNGVGLVLGTAFRFAAYRWLVFSPRSRTLRLPHPARRTVRPDTGGPS
ncbi:Putative flippase GtrA (transmembrane translocase of bactoprenol-linked glucose) [Microbacterium sp. cf332]|nr:Putative flippase GtrA (transmembrane translocase of bactoprenol-linked glucose) [Microbacterium sp. cf332]